MKRFFKISQIILFSSILSSSSIAFFDAKTPTMMSNSLNSSVNQKQQAESVINDSNMDTKSLSFFDDNMLSDSDTPYGYLKVDESTKKIYMISNFGFVLWTYDASQSPFINRNGVSDKTINTIHAKYVPKSDRIIVYGKTNGNNNGQSFIFQINAKDGSNYYVNENNKVPQGSSLVENIDQSMIDSLFQISFLTDDTIILLPQKINSSKEIRTYQVNLSSYLTVPMNINLTTNSQTSNGKNYVLGDIVAFTSFNNNGTIYFESIETESNNKKLGILAVELNNRLNYKSHNFVEFDLVSTNNLNSVNDQDILDKSHFTYKLGTKNDMSQTISFILQDKQYNDSYKSNTVVLFSHNGSGAQYEKISINSTNIRSSSLLTSTTNDVSLTNIFMNIPTGKIFIVGYDVSTKKYGIQEITKSTTSSGSTQNRTLNLEMVNFFSPTETNKKYSLSFKMIHDEIIYKDNLNSKMYGIFTLITMNDSYNVESYQVKKFSIQKQSSSSSITFNDLGNLEPGMIGTTQNLASENSHLLPQDVTLEILERYIYLKKKNDTEASAPNGDRLYNSKLTLNKLVPDNNRGTLTGKVNLNLDKWWIENSQNDDEKKAIFPIDVNISGLATNAGLDFTLVISSSINQEKFRKIQELQKTKYPSQITAQEILDYFIQKGDKVNITVNDICVNNQCSGNNKPIEVTHDDDYGTLTITYDISGKVSPSVVKKTGSATFNNFLQLNTWQQVKLNDDKWNKIKSTKMPFQITKEDIVNSLDLSSSYKTDPSYWIWTPTYSEQNNKTEYIKENIFGTLSGTLKYDRSVDTSVPSSITDETLTLNIQPSSENIANGNNFKTILNSMGGKKGSTFSFNKNKANQMASSLGVEEVEKELNNIMADSIKFHNDWTNISSLTFAKESAENGEITFIPTYSSTSISTNFSKADGSTLILDQDWIQLIKSNSDILDLTDIKLSFLYNQTVFEWNYGIKNGSSSMNINDFVVDESLNNQNLFINYVNETPSQICKRFNDGGNYFGFHSYFKLIKECEDSPTSVDYYEIKGIDLSPNDKDGTISVTYSLLYKNIGSSSEGGVTIYPKIIISGFKSNSNILNNWYLISGFLASTLFLLLVAFITYVIIIKKRSTFQRKNYEKKDIRSINLEEIQIIEKEKKDKKMKIRNTIHTNKHIKSNSHKRINNYLEIRKKMKEK